MANNSKKDDNGEEQYEVKHVVFTSEEDDPGPPPPGFTSRFKNLHEWLVNICDNKKPQKQITTYNFGLFEGEDDYTLCFIGTNTYEMSPDHTVTRIDFTPRDMYFALPMKEYKNLEREKVLKRLTLQLKEFIASEKFRHSFLSRAKSITTDWNGEIWSE